MKSIPKITVITPTLNSEKTLLRTIKSVISQEISPIEYIIIDSCSQDSTRELVAQYGDRINMFSEIDCGIFDGMNKGITLSHAPIIGILNSDDWYLENTLKDVWNEFQSSNADIVIGGVDIYNKERLVSSRIHLVDELETHMVSHPAVFVRKSVYESLGNYNLEYSIAADYDFLLRALKNNVQFSTIPRTLTAYSLGGFSDSPKSRIISIFETQNIRSKYSVITPTKAFATSIFLSIKTIVKRDNKIAMLKECLNQIAQILKRSLNRVSK